MTIDGKFRGPDGSGMSLLLERVKILLLELQNVHKN